MIKQIIQFGPVVAKVLAKIVRYRTVDPGVSRDNSLIQRLQLGIVYATGNEQ